MKLPLLATAILFALSGCAGPTTPLGAPWAIRVSALQARQGVAPVQEPSQQAQTVWRGLASVTTELSGPTIEFHPRSQPLHSMKPLTIVVRDPAGVPDGPASKWLVIRYNGWEVTSSFLLQSRMSRTRDGHEARLYFPHLRLASTVDHQIEVEYHSGRMNAYARYEPPRCRAFSYDSVYDTDSFKPSPELLRAITDISRQLGFNPAFTAALIAQESGFDPTRVSWAKAIGLTQVTPLAEAEIEEKVSRWPRYPGLNQFPVPFVKLLVMSGEANSGNEWRLNAERSVRGGLAYAGLLAERWSESDNVARIREYSPDLATEQTKLILASYNSGYSRVLGALGRRGSAWMSDAEVRGAASYVNRIMSYCDEFSDSEESNTPSKPKETPNAKKT